MIVLLSPSKTQDYSDELSCAERTKPRLLTKTKELAKELKKLSESRLGKTLSVSPKLAALNHERFQKFSPTFSKSNSRQALLAFRGDVYTGFELDAYKKADFSFAQKHLRIISGFYGLLRPLDAMQPYRLEMKTKLKTKDAKDLYEFWGSDIAGLVAKDAKESKSSCVINLASNEYSKAIGKSDLGVEVITPVFKEKKAGALKVIALFAKQARGHMANYIIRKRIKNPAELKKFNVAGYKFQPKLSSDTELVFAR